MTREEILNLGIYETEQLVIDKILGWELTDRGFYADKDGQSPESYYTPANFKPGRDIAAAWAILEQLQKQSDFEFILETAWDELDDAPVLYWDCLIRVRSNPPGISLEPTAPLAICKASLLAVLVPA